MGNYYKTYEDSEIATMCIKNREFGGIGGIGGLPMMCMKILISNQPTSCLCWPMEGRNSSISLYFRRNTGKAIV
jgi:hypothetical protein